MSFFALNNNNLEVVGEDNDDQTFRGVKTRDGDGGLRGALLPASALRDLKYPSRDEAEAVLRESFPMPASWENYLPDGALYPEGALKGLILLSVGTDGRAKMKGGRMLWNEPGIGIMLK
jgi:hypothetical protein